MRINKGIILSETATKSSAGPGPEKGNSGRTFVIQTALLFFVAFIVYANGISNGFNLDDELYTVKAEAFADQGLHSIPYIFGSRTFVDADNHYEYRPIALLSFVLQYIYLSPSPHASHLINVLLYAITCVLLFVLLRKWFVKEHPWFAFLVCLIFTTHPLHTEIVDSLKNRDELLAFLFSLLALTSIWKLYETKKWGYGILYILLFFLALFSKKTAAPILMLVPLAFYFFSNLSRKKLVGYALLGIAPLVLFRITLKLMALPLTRITFVHENPFYGVSGNVHVKAATCINIIGRYLYLHFVPVRLAYYYGYKYVLVVDWTSIYVWISLFLHAAFIYLIIKYIRNKSILCFGALLYILAVIAYSNILRLAPGMMAERFMYLPSLGFSIALSAIIFMIFRTKLPPLQKNRGAITLVLAICVFFAALSFERNKNWKDKYTLYHHDMAYLDSSAKANSMYAEQLILKARLYKVQAKQSISGSSISNVYTDSAALLLSEAKERYKTALRITPDFPNALNNIGIILIEQDSIPLAKEYLQRSLKTTTQRSRVYHDLAMIYRQEGIYDSSLLFFKRSINEDSTFLDAYSNLSKLLIEHDDTVNAEQVLLLAAVKNTKSSIPYIQLADISLFKHDTTSIVYYCEKAAELKPANLAILSFLVTHYEAKNEQHKARYYRDKLAAIQAKNE